VGFWWVLVGCGGFWWGSDGGLMVSGEFWFVLVGSGWFWWSLGFW
jgi:hypothetical protein